MVGRRLPIYLLIDTSGSMDGAPINAVNQGIHIMEAALRTDPRAVETAFISVLTFDSSARQVIPLVEVGSFTAPMLQASGATNLGEGLKLLEDCLRREVIANSTEGQKGDWKPLVFIMTDGLPTDAWESAADSIKRQKIGNIIGCAAGDGADEQMLKRVADHVVKLTDTSEASIQGFFKWVTQSAKVASASVGSQSGQQTGIALPPPPPNGGIVIVP